MSAKGKAAGLAELMEAVVTEGTGSAGHGGCIYGGDQDRIGEFETERNHDAWFTGFAPAESCGLVVTVLVERQRQEGARP